MTCEMKTADTPTSSTPTEETRTGIPKGHTQPNKPSEGKLKKLFLGKFKDDAEEELFQLYIRNQKLKIIPAFVISTVIYLASSIAVEIVYFDLEHRLGRVVTYSCFIVLALLGQALLSRKSISPRMITLTVVFLWVVMTTALLLDKATTSTKHTATGAVGWVMVLIFTTFVVVPWKLRYVLGVSIVVAVAYCAEMLSLCVRPEETGFQVKDLFQQFTATFLLFLCAILLGVLVFVFSDHKQRRSFVESKKSHAISYQIEKEYREQERLLLSVLPKHVADEMIQDLGTDIGGQFRKIYMSRYENVSILFADIVGFTAISSSVTAAELMKILNQLFASFDDLANKFHQQRIKILGDCYYCVCGADQRPDHAVLSIHMGMSVVEAIRAVREKTAKEVNMRVGIHTGSVLGGVLGQRRWQYDVLGKEVTLANHMESGGLAGRVHISETTEQLLHGEFCLEPGYGIERDDYLKLLNINTYLVKSILKPYPMGTCDVNRRSVASANEQEKQERRGLSKIPNMQEIWESSTDSTFAGVSQNLREALLDRTRSREAMRQMSVVTTWFHASDAESRYRERRERFSGASMGALCVVLLLSTSAKLAVLPRTLPTILTFVAAEMILIFMAVVPSMLLLQTRFRMPKRFLQFGLAIEGHNVSRIMWGVTAILILIFADAATIIQCDVGKAKEAIKNLTGLADLDPEDIACPYPAYFVHVVHLILLGISSLVQLEHMTKFIVVILATTIYSVLYMIVYSPLFDFYDHVVFKEQDKVVPSKYRLSVQLISASLALLVLNRKMEEISRHLFLWKEESEKQTKRASELRHKNEALVYNILPAHVARDFIGHQRKHMDLYSNAYDEAAVMFAACPNFHDFYNESAVNKEGLECLRFLNEIISDYDELLSKPQFQSITKIKTVGPTYMAASGMCNEYPCPRAKSKDVRTRWQHLDDLVQFALAMKKELAYINEQSFNNFILRIGINHGPIIAGVIGAMKPHYDIWGNTVNVASRMESTGMADKIQVVQETKLILEEFGYLFKKRGFVKVKGKGELMTYFLEGQDKTLIGKPRRTSRISTSVHATPYKPEKQESSMSQDTAKQDLSKQDQAVRPKVPEKPHGPEEKAKRDLPAGTSQVVTPSTSLLPPEPPADTSAVRLKFLLELTAFLKESVGDDLADDAEETGSLIHVVTRSQSQQSASDTPPSS